MCAKIAKIEALEGGPFQNALEKERISNHFVHFIQDSDDDEKDGEESDAELPQVNANEVESEEEEPEPELTDEEKEQVKV